MADLTDLEITKLCAEAMGLEYWVSDALCDGVYLGKEQDIYQIVDGEQVMTGPFYTYRPLHDDAQCMALVKKFKLEPRFAGKIGTSWHGQWLVTQHNTREPLANHSDLNCAICLCVARMQQAKEAGND